MQNINVLIKGIKKESDKTEETANKLEKQQQSLKQAIETLQTQLDEIEEKEQSLLKEDMMKNMGKD